MIDIQIVIEHNLILFRKLHTPLKILLAFNIILYILSIKQIKVSYTKSILGSHYSSSQKDFERLSDHFLE